ncbi:Copper amine oxidase N-terminal domain-containing protein [Paenibacillus sophorae]|uniref:Copper amine oxidase N-terminal domain-containing protein n=1 Tax=Paenibacillus sophorae TaxID=1333845 RepID=A0A1H8JWQ8_9BACL|nr:copper amine oxidase N-terminal domain-containing protein [Paenibacillus sophorae]QWU13514.1 copper amine oxidase N-terminal domain-containing protein [Paenibacillus sophorae]SEN85184.1 Copper amine oxidase N-terminal domain-containing protein [Paenibacillus sophorae]
MKHVKKRAKWLLPILALLLVLAGCQTVGGLDLNKALLGNLDVKSAEESVSIALNAVPATGISAEDQKIIDLINSFTLNVSHLKLQEGGDISASGTLGFKQASIPFTFYMSKTVLALNVQGAKKPFYFPMDGYNQELSAAGLDLEKAESVSKLLSQFVIKNLPNPSAINVTPVNEAVYGESLNLMKLHAEVTGDELPVLLKAFLKSVSQDTEGFTELISGLYDYLLPVLKQQSTTDMLSSIGLGDVPLDNKAEVVTVLHDAAKLAVDTALLLYDKQLDKLYQSTPEIKTVLSKDTKLQVDLFVDSALHVRKQNLNLNVVLPNDGSIPIRSISLKTETQVWNINGSVKADPIASEGALNVLETPLSPGVILRNFNEDSTAYSVLKNDLGITKKSIVIDPETDYSDIVVKGTTTMIPLRYLAAVLDAQVKWDAASKQITVTDDIYGTTIELKAGSKDAVVDGAKVKLSQPVYFDRYGRGYVPLRSVAEALHAQVKVDGDGLIYITRD